MRFEAVIDSYAWVEYFRGTDKGEKAKAYIEEMKTATPTIVLAELSGKYHKEGWDFWDQDLEFITSSSAILDLTTEIAVKAGKTRNEMKKTRANFGLADAIILETARAAKAKVLTGDEHFKGLKESIYLE